MPAPRADGPTRVSRADHREQTRSALLESARRLFSERGYQAVSAEEIAADAGVTERTLFRYFPTKASLVLHRFMELTPELLERVAARPAHEGPYSAICEALIELAAAHRELVLPDLGPDWHSVALPDMDRERLLIELVAPIAETLRLRYGLRPSDRLRSEIWARAAVVALASAMSVAAHRQAESDRRIRVGPTLRSAFAALDGTVSPPRPRR